MIGGAHRGLQHDGELLLAGRGLAVGLGGGARIERFDGVHVGCGSVRRSGRRLHVAFCSNSRSLDTSGRLGLGSSIGVVLIDSCVAETVDAAVLDRLPAVAALGAGTRDDLRFAFLADLSPISSRPDPAIELEIG